MPSSIFNNFTFIDSKSENKTSILHKGYFFILRSLSQAKDFKFFIYALVPNQGIRS